MISNRKDLKYYLKEDRVSLGLKQSRCSIASLLFPDPIWVFQKTLRYLEYYSNIKNPLRIPIWLFYKWKYRRISLKLGFSIPLNVIGPGLSIAHYGTIVISSQAKIGKNCRLHACVNIGASGGNAGAPQLGDNVYIGPGALLFGEIKIGNNNTIGANATVNRSFPESNVVIAGVPAEIVKRDAPDWTVFNNRNNPR